jgi:hypothetical protein
VAVTHLHALVVLKVRFLAVTVPLVWLCGQLQSSLQVLVVELVTLVQAHVVLTQVAGV